MLRELQLQNYNRPVDSLVFGGMAEDLILDPVYQRGSVWTVAQQQQLAKSILQGLPIGALFLNHRSWKETVVVDGKQRVEALRAIIGGEIVVPRGWVEDFDRPGNAQAAVETARLMNEEIAYPDWSERAKRAFSFHGVATYETHFAAPNHLRAELDLFERVNWGGTAQEPEVAERVAALRASL